MARILVIDDDPDACRLMVHLLNSEGHDTTGVTTGADALDAITTHRPHLAILDLMMPDMDGWQVLKWIRCRYSGSELPVIIHSAVCDAGSIQQARAMGANDFWVKASRSVDEMFHSVESHVRPRTPSLRKSA